MMRSVPAVSVEDMLGSYNNDLGRQQLCSKVIRL